MDLSQNNIDERFKRVTLGLSCRRLVILAGGNSSEAEVSKVTGRRVHEVLEKTGLDTELVDPDGFRILDWEAKLKNVGMVFVAMHGGWGENGQLQGLLDRFGVVYTGSGVEGSCLGMDKLASKRIWQAIGVNTPEIVEFRNCKKTVFPLVVKIAAEGSGRGVFLVKKFGELEKLLIKLKDKENVFIERYVGGREISSMVVEERGVCVVLPILEAKFKQDFFDYDARYQNKGHAREVPARLALGVRKKIEDDSIKAFRALNLRDYARFDIRLGNNSVPYFLEATSLPGMTTTSWMPAMFEAAGVDFEHLVKYLVCLAWERGKNEKV